MSTTRFVHPEVKVIDKPYIIFTTKYGIDFNTGAKLEADMKAKVMFINAEPTLEESVITIDKMPISVWLPCVVLRGCALSSDSQSQTILRVVYDQYFVAESGGTELIQRLQDQASRRPNTYNPLYRR